MVEDLGWQVSEATGPTHGRTSNHIRGLAISVKVYSILRAKCSSICLSVTPFLHIVCSMYYVLFLLFSLSPPYSLLTTSHPLLPLPSSPPYSLLTTSHPLLPLSPLFSSLSHYFPPPSSLSPPLPIPFSLPPPPYSLLTTSHPLLPPHTQTFWLPVSSQSHKMLYLESGTYCKTNDGQNESTNDALRGTCTRSQPSPPIHSASPQNVITTIAIRKHVYDKQ